MDDDNEILNDKDTVLEPLEKVMKALRTSEECSLQERFARMSRKYEEEQTGLKQRSVTVRYVR